MEAEMIAKQSSPSLQQRIVSVLANSNASASELSALVAETELAIVTADETIASERANATDLISTPTADAAQDAISRAEAAALNQARLQSALPQLRAHYTEALATERRDRWESDRNKVSRQRDELLEEYNGVQQAYLSAKADRDKLLRRMEDCDLDIERINILADDLNIYDLQLEPMLDPPIQERRWGPPRVEGGLAVAMAQSMVPPAYNPADWSKPEVQQQRRAGLEKQHREIGEFYQRQTEQQEERINREERERFAASRRAT
jgi:hypothetical protein